MDGTGIDETTEIVEAGNMGDVEINVTVDLIGQQQINCSAWIGGGKITEQKTFTVIGKTFNFTQEQ